MMPDRAEGQRQQRPGSGKLLAACLDERSPAGRDLDQPGLGQDRERVPGESRSEAAATGTPAPGVVMVTHGRSRAAALARAMYAMVPERDRPGPHRAGTVMTSSR